MLKMLLQSIILCPKNKRTWVCYKIDLKCHGAFFIACDSPRFNKWTNKTWTFELAGCYTALIDSYRRFGETYQSHRHWSSCPRIAGLGTRLTRCNIPEDRNLDSYSRQYLKITYTECLLL